MVYSNARRMMIYSYARSMMIYSYATIMMMYKYDEIHYRLCFSLQLNRNELLEMLEPASTIDIARKMAGDLASVYRTEDPGRDTHDDSFEQKIKDLYFWQTIYRSLK